MTDDDKETVEYLKKHYGSKIARKPKEDKYRKQIENFIEEVYLYGKASGERFNI